MKNQSEKFKQFLDSKNIFQEYVNNISDPKIGGAISTAGSVDGFLEQKNSQDYIFDAFYFNFTTKPKFWVLLSAEWNSMLNGTKPAQKISDFIFKSDGFTIFEKGEVRAELNQASDKLSFFVDIKPSMFYNSPAELDDDIQSEKLGKGLIYLKKLLSELK